MEEPETISDLLAMVERDYEIGQPGISAISVTGEPFVTLSGAGLTSEALGGKPSPSETDAIRSFWYGFREYARNRAATSRGSLTLYWREKPSMLKQLQGPETRHQIWARLLISDKPPLAKE